MEAVVVMRYHIHCYMGEIRSRSGQNASINNDCIYGRRTQAVTVNNTMIHVTQPYEAGGMVRRF
jgi:hypothetical protein